MLTSKDLRDLQRIFRQAFRPFNAKMKIMEHKLGKILKVHAKKK